MSPFQEELARLKERIEGNLPPAYLELMHGETRALEASGVRERTLQAGTPAPDFDLEDQNGELRTRTSLLEQGPLAITFYRGFWCPYCNADLKNLEKHREQIEATGATLLAVSPELPKYTRKVIHTQKLGFDILRDPGNQLAAQFGLKFLVSDDLKQLYRSSFNVNLKLYHGTDEWSLPMPARYVIDTDGMLRYAESCPDYTRRPDPDELIHCLSSL